MWDIELLKKCIKKNGCLKVKIKLAEMDVYIAF